MSFHYRDVQHGYIHPHLTDPLTYSLEARLSGDHPMVWREPEIDGDRVTFHYWQPLILDGYRSWNFVQVWETWWPIERERHGTTYHGLARLIEVEMPDAWKRGFQVMVNNGFGPNGGSREGVKSYSSGFRRPAHEVVDFSGEANRQVFFQSPKPPRRGAGYHPSHDCLQSSPLLFFNWETGSLTITARSLYYYCANNSASYIEQGADGVWPNLAWDLGTASRRTAVETVEYLYAGNPEQPLPQRYMNARFEALGDVSRRYGLQDDVPAATAHETVGEVAKSGGLEPFAEEWLERLKETGIDGFYVFRDFWFGESESVDEATRTDPGYGVNPDLKRFCDRFREAGYKIGHWTRPEVAKTSITMALSERYPTATVYGANRSCQYPPIAPGLEAEGMPVVRKHPEWIRCQRDGSHPVKTAYEWVPMSMASGWWDEVTWPTIWMSAQLGFDMTLTDGAFGGLSGVDYAPMRAGMAEGAIPCQPFWWRVFRSMAHVGLKNFGECTLGWKGGFVNCTGDGDEHYLWMFGASCIWANRHLLTPEVLHRLFQVYCGTEAGRLLAPGHEREHAVCRYASRFFREYGSPEWIELRDLTRGEEREVTGSVAESPVAGFATRITEADTYSLKVTPWTWTDAVWHYSDGRSVTYPAFDRIDWKIEQV